jgi:glycosyltransferase involved in cell wall biosynthesis
MAICLFAGGATAFNVRRTVDNWGRMLEGTDELHLVTCDPEAFGDVAGFETFGGGGGTGRRREVEVLRSYLRTHHPAVIAHVTQPPIHGTIVGALARRHDVPSIYRYAGDRFYQFRLHSGAKRVALYGLNNLVGRLPLHLSDRFVALGPHGRGRLVAYGARPDRVCVLPPSVDPARFEGDRRADVDVPADRRVVLFLGRISRLKGVGTIERTIDEVLARRPDLHFVFVGGEERRPEVPPEYEDHLTFVGRVPPAEVPAYLRRADVLAHPSLTEGVPRAVLEALFAGTPVIARDVGDTASVTGNTFRSDREFVELLCSFEDLPLDDPTPFSVDSLRPKYQTLFTYYTDRTS